MNETYNTNVGVDKQYASETSKKYEKNTGNANNSNNNTLKTEKLNNDKLDQVLSASMPTSGFGSKLEDYSDKNKDLDLEVLYGQSLAPGKQTDFFNELYKTELDNSVDSSINFNLIGNATTGTYKNNINLLQSINLGQVEYETVKQNELLNNELIDYKNNFDGLDMEETYNILESRKDDIVGAGLYAQQLKYSGFSIEDSLKSYDIIKAEAYDKYYLGLDNIKEGFINDLLDGFANGYKAGGVISYSALSLVAKEASLKDDPNNENNKLKSMLNDIKGDPDKLIKIGTDIIKSQNDLYLADRTGFVGTAIGTTAGFATGFLIDSYITAGVGKVLSSAGQLALVASGKIGGSLRGIKDLGTMIESKMFQAIYKTNKTKQIINIQKIMKDNKLLIGIADAGIASGKQAGLFNLLATTASAYDNSEKLDGQTLMKSYVTGFVNGLLGGAGASVIRGKFGSSITANLASFGAAAGTNLILDKLVEGSVDISMEDIGYAIMFGAMDTYFAFKDVKTIAEKGINHNIENKGLYNKYEKKIHDIATKNDMKPANIDKSLINKIIDSCMGYS